MRDNEREIFTNRRGGTYYIDEDLQRAMEEFEAFYGNDGEDETVPEQTEESGAGVPLEQAPSPQPDVKGNPESKKQSKKHEKNPQSEEQPEEQAKSEAQPEEYEEQVSVVVPKPSENIDEQFNIEDFGGVGMSDIYKSDAQNANEEPVKERKGLRIFATILAILLLCAIVFVSGYIAYNVKMIKERDKKREEQKKIAAETATTEAPTTEEATTEEKYDGWIADAEVINPEKSEKTISIPAADLSVFEEEENDASQEGEEKPDPWTLVTLNLDPVEGSINITSPGDPAQTTQLTSTYMVLVDLDTEEIVAERDCEKVVPPASMTKILTVITARDYVSEENLDEKFTITQDIIDETNRSGLSAVGFKADSEVTVRDLLYGTIVCSGADAAIGLARYCCGTEEAFVERMNENVEQLGLSETAHFTNPVGKYEEELHCTMKDMAVILNVAMQDELLRDVLSKRIYTTDVKYPDPEKEKELEEAIEAGTAPADATVAEEDYLNIEISNWFLRRIEDKEMLGNVIGAKTGFVNKSGFCAASYYEANNGKRYICVTGNANSSWRAIYDHVAVYRALTN